MKDPFVRIGIAIFVCVLLIAYRFFFEGVYATVQLYWIVQAILRVMFWCIIFYPKYRWRSLSSCRKIIVVAVSIDFCLAFLPIDILLSDVFDRARSAIDWAVLISILWDDRDDGGGGKGKRLEDDEEEYDNSRLATDNI